MAKNNASSNNVVFKRKTASFSTIANPIIDDKSITPAAGWLYVIIQRWITFNADNFECSKSFIASKYNAGAYMFDRAWDELKEHGYLKMYSHPIEGWQAELLDVPEPNTPHTYYLDKAGQLKSTNLDRAEKKAAKLAELVQNDHYPENHPNGDHYPENHSNGNHTNGEHSNGNGGNMINTINKNSNNILLDQSINQDNDINEAKIQAEKIQDRLIDGKLIEEIKKQIDYDSLISDGVFSSAISADDVDGIVDAIAVLKTANKPMKFGDSTYTPDFIRQRADQIDSEHVEYVFECFYENREEVRNIKKYLTSAIFNAPATCGSFYANRVKSSGMV